MDNIIKPKDITYYQFNNTCGYHLTWGLLQKHDVIYVPMQVDTKAGKLYVVVYPAFEWW